MLSNNIRIFSYTPENNASLNEEVNQTVDYYNSTIFGYPDFKLISDKPINLTDASTYNSVPSYELIYSYTDPDFNTVNTTEIITKPRDKFYSISYSAREEEFSKYLPVFSRMIDSDSLLIFNLLRHEMLGMNSSGIILRYPDTLYPWELREIGDKSINLMRENPEAPDIKTDFILSVYPLNESLSVLAEKERRRDNHAQQDFQILNENRTYIIDTNLDGNITAHKIAFSYYDKTIEEDVQGVQVYTNFSNNAFILTYLSESLFYDEYLPIEEEIIDSLKIIDMVEYIDHELIRLDPKYSQELGLSLEYPKSWNLTSRGIAGFSVNNSDALFDIRSSSAPTDSLATTVGVEINDLKSIPDADFTIIESIRDFIRGHSSHKIVFTFTDWSLPTNENTVKGMSIYAVIGNRLVVITYYNQLDKFASYLPTIEKKIIQSLTFVEARSDRKVTQSGIILDGSPVDLAINSVTDKIYVAVPEASNLYVVNGTDDTILSKITLGGYPNAVAVNPITNTIYVSSVENDKVYVIDGYTDKVIDQIKAGPVVGDMSIDTNEFGGYGSIIFIANSGDNSVSILDGTTNKMIGNVTTDEWPFSISVNPITNRAYITGLNNTISVIDYVTDIDHTFSGELIEPSIEVGLAPRGIIVDHNTDKVYVSNSGQVPFR